MFHDVYIPPLKGWALCSFSVIQTNCISEFFCYSVEYRDEQNELIKNWMYGVLLMTI